MSIHPTAVIHPGAKISSEVEIGPYAVIEDNVMIGPRVKIFANACVCSYTKIGEDSEVHMGAVIGNYPQDLSFKKRRTELVIGKRNTIREYATINRGTEENSSTIIGDDNYIMCFGHIGHNCELGNNIVMANSSALSGGVTVEDRVFISAYVGVHQYVRIGAISMIGGQGRVTRDVPPYMLLKGDDTICSINSVGLRRAGFSRATRSSIKKAYKILYRSGMSISEAVKELERSGPEQEVRHLIDFLKKKSKRGITQHI